MDKRTQKKLEAAGWVVGDAADLLGLTEAESQLIDLRIGIGQAVREGRQARDMTQKELATLIRTTQPRVAKIEAAAPDVSLDLMLRGFFAVGGRLTSTLKPVVSSPGEKVTGDTAARNAGARARAKALEKSVIEADEAKTAKTGKMKRSTSARVKQSRRSKV